RSPRASGALPSCPSSRLKSHTKERTTSMGADHMAGATPIVFGDIQSAYRIYDRVGLSVLRNPYTLDVYGQTRFTARRRVGASVVRPEAIRKLRIAAN
ncbi:phage major capsid protein, partial [Methylobacterium sp. Leaf100]|uniref:phage major capsid protein n=1 Tax=Methylobacterium sp. Leaf100 TaxID=1736252 RepID=UPI0012E2EA35